MQTSNVTLTVPFVIASDQGILVFGVINSGGQTCPEAVAVALADREADSMQLISIDRRVPELGEGKSSTKFVAMLAETTAASKADLLITLDSGRQVRCTSPVVALNALEPSVLQQVHARYSPALDDVLSEVPEAFDWMAAACASFTAVAGLAATYNGHVIVGHFDQVYEKYAEGWAYCPDLPMQRFEVDVMNGDRIVGRGYANMMRSDLLDNKIGDGCYRFVIPLSNELGDSESCSLLACVSGTSHVLKGAAQFYRPARLAERLDSIPYAELKKLTQAFAAEASLPQAFVSSVLAANLLLETQQSEPAIRAFQQVIQAYGDSPLLQCKIGEAYLAVHQVQMALDFYRKALSLDAGFIYANLGVGNCCVRLQLWPEAHEAYVRLGSAFSQSPALSARKRLVRIELAQASAQVYMEQGRFADAIIVFKSILAQDPDRHYVAEQLRRALRQQNGLESSSQGYSSSQAFLLDLQVFDLILDEAEAYLEFSSK